MLRSNKGNAPQVLEVEHFIFVPFVNWNYGESILPFCYQLVFLDPCPEFLSSLFRAPVFLSLCSQNISRSYFVSCVYRFFGLRCLFCRGFVGTRVTSAPWGRSGEVAHWNVHLCYPPTSLFFNMPVPTSHLVRVVTSRTLPSFFLIMHAY